MAVFVAERRESRRVVPGYGGRYEVGDLGRVYSGGCEMSLIGGRYVKLCQGGRVDRVDVGYLVARAFVPNAEGRPYVLHRDGDRRNNRAENLEWSERKEKHVGGRPVVDTRPVAQYSRDGVCLARYGSIREAVAFTGVSRAVIRNSAEGRTSRPRGYVWRYE